MLKPSGTPKLRAQQGLWKPHGCLVGESTPPHPRGVGVLPPAHPGLFSRVADLLNIFFQHLTKVFIIVMYYLLCFFLKNIQNAKSIPFAWCCNPPKRPKDLGLIFVPKAKA